MYHRLHLRHFKQYDLFIKKPFKEATEQDVFRVVNPKAQTTRSGTSITPKFLATVSAIAISLTVDAFNMSSP